MLRKKLENLYRDNGDCFSDVDIALKNFYNRYEKISKQNVREVKSFLLSEIEALELFLEKQKKELDKSKEAVLKPKKKGEKSMIESIYEGYAKKLKYYPKAHLHKNSFEEIEHLCGAMELFQAKHELCFSKLGNGIKRGFEKETFLKMEMLMNDLFTSYSGKKSRAFLEYIREVEKCGNNREEIEKKGQVVLKKVLSFVELINRLLGLIEENGTDRWNGVRFVYTSKAYKFSEYKNFLKNDCDMLLKIFRLTGLL